MPTDVAVLDWAGLTVRVAWTLLRLGIRVRPAVLEEVRRHVLFHVDAALTPAAAEDLAEHLTESFVARAKGLRPSDPWVHDWDMPLSDRWRRAVESSLDTDAYRYVFLKHYGDNRPLSHLANVMMMDRVALEGAQAGLRQMVRELGRSDRLPIREWPEARIDRLLRRLAAYAPGPCPPPLDVVDGCAREHTRTCPRCNRLARLVQSSVLQKHQIIPPSIRARPRERARVLALQIHPEGHAFRRALAAELPTLAFPVGDDLLLLDADELEQIRPALITATEVGSPRAEFVRGALLEGFGVWGEHGLAGPLAEQALHAVTNQVWGEVAGIGTLPDELDHPPSAAPWWIGVAGLLVTTLLLVQVAFQEPAPPVQGTLEVAFTTASRGTWAHFDVPETALVTIVADTGQGLAVVLDSRTPGDKMALAVGDGTYRTLEHGTGLLVAAHDTPLDLQAFLADANQREVPLLALQTTLSAHAEVRLHHRDY